jgi:arylsulfatase A-like enzyme/Tfp pilus assembly protein PilF
LSARRKLALALGLLALAAAAALQLGRGGRPADRRVRPSVVLVTLDTLRADRVGAWGGPRGLTPNLDALAARGAVFEEAVASAPLTLPSHATILTGLEPPRHGVHDNGSYALPADVDTLATRLLADGYATGAFVSAYVLDRRFGLARGFGVYDDRIARNASGASVLESRRGGAEVVEAARAWLASGSGPFLLWVHLYDAHAPYEPPSPYREAHAGQPYDGAVAFVDACVGTLLEAVRARTGRERGGEPLVAVIGDHGESLGEHGERTHGFFLYQPTLRVPWLMAGPGIAAGVRRSGVARTADLLPTLMGALGVPVAAGLDGVDRLKQRSPRESYAETFYPAQFGWATLRSFRADGVKLVDAPRPELYDVASDPGETHDLSRERPDAVAKLRQAVRALRQRGRASAFAAPDAATQERLRSLGYAGASASTQADELNDLPDPKDKLQLFLAFEDALRAQARGDRDGALATLLSLVHSEPANGLFRRSLAAALRQSGRRAEAIAVLGTPGRLRQDAPAWHQRALALAEAGRASDAEASERTALALDPALAEAHNQLGILLAGRGRLEEALAEFRMATSLDPTDARAWNNAANALRGLGRGEEARTAYERAAELAPRDPDPLNGLGTLAVQSGRPQEAVTLFRRALALADVPEVRLNLAVAFVQARQPQEALRELDTLVGRTPASDVTRRARALRAQVATSIPSDPSR